jgi:hypothetical protein
MHGCHVEFPHQKVAVGSSARSFSAKFQPLHLLLRRRIDFNCFKRVVPSRLVDLVQLVITQPLSVSLKGAFERLSGGPSRSSAPFTLICIGLPASASAP